VRVRSHPTVERSKGKQDIQAGKRATDMQITTPFIKLDSLLKAENAVSSGGEAKAMIAEGYISVNGEVEFRRGRKLYPGDRVVYGKRKFLVEAA
jgi:ribosome-associated protein